MGKVFHKKLVRDKIPEIIEKNGDVCETRILNDWEFEIELRKKLVEESEEVLNCSKEKLVDELADVLEIVSSLADNNQIKMEDVEKEMRLKREKRGGFDKKIFLEWSGSKS
jgi:predicted house-cleaning noncanonical NTP pyrophosphatase (MazG superfamily)